MTFVPFNFMRLTQDDFFRLAPPLLFGIPVLKLFHLFIITCSPRIFYHTLSRLFHAASNCAHVATATGGVRRANKAAEPAG